jgi:threonylcarbamoyladenosine tRNA methylthiotransferase MtaB
VRKLRPVVAFGADIIAGFQTETDEMFQNTLNLVHEAGLQYLHVFPYSIREGTPAAKMPQVKGDIKKERANKLREAGEIELAKHLQKNIGKTLKTIVEKDKIARAEDFSEIKITSEHEIGSVIDVEVMAIVENSLLGKITIS